MRFQNFAAAVAFGIISASANAQSAEVSEPSCSVVGAEDRTGKFKVGSDVVVIRRRAGAEKFDDDACEVVVVDATTKVRYRARGFGVIVGTAARGMDVDGDGSPDLVFYIDVGGGNHCCTRVDVVSFKPQAHRIMAFDEDGAAWFKRDPQQRVVLHSTEGGFGSDRYGMAERVFAERVYRLEKGKLVDVTAYICATVKDSTGIERKEPPADEVASFLKAGTLKEHEDTGSAVESLMLQHVFCGDYNRARDVAMRMWPEADRKRLLHDFASQVGKLFPFTEASLASWK